MFHHSSEHIIIQTKAFNYFQINNNYMKNIKPELLS